jgi:hypothetical protein
MEGRPEVVRVGAEQAQGVLEGELDLEAQPVRADDLERHEAQVGGDEDRTAARCVIDQHEAHQRVHRPPDEVA